MSDECLATFFDKILTFVGDEIRSQIPGKKGFPRFKKPNRSVEYKLTGYQLSDQGRKIKFTDGFKAGEFDLWCSQKTLVYYSEQQIRRVRVVRRADGYYCQFLIDVERQEYHKPTGKITGLDLGLKEFYTDAQGNTVENPRYLSKSEKRLKKAQRRLSKKFRQGKKQFKKFLVNGKPYFRGDHDIRLRKFQTYLGLGYSYQLSGDTSAKQDKVKKSWKGSDLMRSHL
jgi:transposase